MLKKLNEIKVEKVLELFAANLIKARKIYIDSKKPINLYDLNPSLMDQLKVVENLKKEIKYDGYALGLKGAGRKAGDIEIKAYNFFLIGYFIPFDYDEKGCSYVSDIDFKIYGFDNFSSLNRFIVENPDNIDDFALIVKDIEIYKEVFYRFVLKSGKGVARFVSHEKFAKAKKSTCGVDVPLLCEFFERESTVEEARDFFEQEEVLKNREILEKNSDFDYKIRLCESKDNIEDCLVSGNFLDIMSPTENRARYGYITYNNKNSFSLATYKYYLACEDGRGYFDMKRIQAIDTVRNDT